MARPPRPALWGLGFGVLYLWGGARLPQWADASKLTLYALAHHVPSLNPGDHPGWTLLAWLWLKAVPLDPVVACHRLSALAGALSVLLLVKLLALRDKPPEVVRGAAVVWGFAHAVWWAASMTETYTLAFALTLGALVAERKGRPLLAAGLAGWAAATHALTLFLTVPALAKRTRWVARGCGFLLGASPVWLGLFLTPGEDPVTGHVSAGLSSLPWHVRSFLNPSRLSLGLGLLGGLVLWNLGPLGLWAWWRGRGESRKALLPLAALGLFLALYAPFRLHLMVGLWLLGLLLWRPPALTRIGAVAHVLLQVGLYLGFPALLSRTNLSDLRLRPLPYRSNAWYFLNPVKRNEESAHRYALEILATAPPNAVVLADFNPGAVLKLYQKTRNLRPDLTLLPTAVDNCLGTPSPAACLGRHVQHALDRGHPVLLADSYDPYYRLKELQRLGFDLASTASGAVEVRLGWRADRDSNPEP